MTPQTDARRSDVPLAHLGRVARIEARAAAHAAFAAHPAKRPDVEAV